MDPFGGLLGIAGLASQSSNSGLATALQWMNLQFQKENARKQFDLATAGRTDAYGNKQRYNPLTNEWEFESTPTQNQILRAGESEQLRSLTEDAQRNRNVRRTAYARGQEAGRDYNEALAGYRYDQPKSEEAIRDELTGLLSNAKSSTAKEGQDKAINAAIRTGHGGSVAKIIRDTDNALGAEMGDTALKARTLAIGEYGQRRQAHDARYLPELKTFQAIMDAVGNGPQMFSKLPEAQAAQQGDMAKMIEQALGNEGRQVGGAYDSLSKSIGGGIGVKDMASLISAMNGGRGRYSGGGATRASSTNTGAFENDGGSYSDEDRIRPEYFDFQSGW